MTIERGLELYSAGRYNDAYDAFQEVDIDPAENPELAYSLGLCCARIDRRQEALNYFYLSIDVDYNLIRIYQSRMIIAYLNILDKKYQDARRQIDRILGDGYSSTQIHLLLGYLLYEEGSVAEAVIEYKRALNTDANNHTALNNLGYLLADREMDVTQGIELCRRAVLSSPDSPVYLDSLGWAFFKQGDYRNSRTFLTKARDIRPDNRIIRLHLEQLGKAI